MQNVGINVKNLRNMNLIGQVDLPSGRQTIRDNKGGGYKKRISSLETDQTVAIKDSVLTKQHCPSTNQEQLAIQNLKPFQSRYAQRIRTQKTSY